VQSQPLAQDISIQKGCVVGGGRSLHTSPANLLSLAVYYWSLKRVV
jgi:hypothetical protein